MADLPNALQPFHEAIKDCQKCALAAGRTQVVFGSGNPTADIMFVGEAPGYYEDKEGRPFVGAAGKLLDSLLQEIGLQRSEIFIVNVLKCRPPQNRDPLPDEVEACKPYLFRQIELIKALIEGYAVLVEHGPHGAIGEHGAARETFDEQGGRHE